MSLVQEQMARISAKLEEISGWDTPVFTIEPIDSIGIVGKLSLTIFNRTGARAAVHADTWEELAEKMIVCIHFLNLPEAPK